MKHSWKITFVLMLLFFVTQLFGLATISKSIEVTEEAGVVVIKHKDTIVGPPPKTESGFQSILILTLAVLIGTLLLLLLIKLKIHILFKYWYLLAVFVTIAITFGVYVTWFTPSVNSLIAILLAFSLAWLKVHRSNVFVHNITEIFIYAGIAVLFVSLFEGWLWAAFVLLIVISVYDMFAVWQSKHMIKIAQYQTASKIFAGLSIPYTVPKKQKKQQKDEVKVLKKSKAAILGGGDLAFPLLFAGSVMSHLILSIGLDKNTALLFSSFIAATSTLSLFLLLWKSQKDRFYPAMPFLSLGCFIGYGVILLVI